jgi:cytochrome c551
MNLSRLLLIAAAISLLGVACNKSEPANTGTGTSAPAATPAAKASPDEFVAARTTYAKRCAGCHGEKGEGGTVEVEGKKIKGPPFRTGHALNHSDQDFIKQINKGGDGMPPFADKLSAKEIDDMVRFIRHDFQAGNNPQASSVK